MQLLAPDILAEAKGLPAGYGVAGLVLGLLLWSFGWWGHRFWIVLSTTLLAGVFALSAGPPSGVQPLVVAVLVAVAAGALSLALSRVLVFAGGGLACWLAVHAAAPSWDQPLIVFLAGGLLALLLFRFWTMFLTSLAGTLLMAYSGLCLAGQLGKLDVVAWTGKNAAWLSWACLGVAAVGWLVQFLLERRRAERLRKRREQEEQLVAKAREKEKEKKPAPRPKPWWTVLLPGLPLRKAG
jgi:hypothetical protein